MEEAKIKSLITECKQIEEDSLYTAEVHYLISHKLGVRAFWFKLTPALITTLSAFSLLVGAPNWVSWITMFSGITTIVNTFLEPEKKAKDHLFAAKNFTVLKHEARSLYETFKEFIDIGTFYQEVKRLREKYNLLVTMTPPTDDEKAWEKARQRIKSGVHKADFREN